MLGSRVESVWEVGVVRNFEVGERLLYLEKGQWSR
jgi:hypothetical protein